MAGQAEQPTGIDFDQTGYMRKLDKRIRRLTGATESDVRATGQFVVNAAKRFAAVKTGFMRSNIVLIEGTDAKGFYVEVHCRASYWVHVEFGTVDSRAQPFMRPAFALGKQYFIDRVTKRMREA